MPEPMVYPLTFDPVFKDYLWGGRRLSTQLGRTIPAGIVAELWEVAAHPDGSSTVRAGPLAGMPLPEIQHRWGEALVGSRNGYALSLDRFPLLIKLLDASRWLSVQVHPDDEYGLAHEQDLGKTEMWVILDAEPQAELILGFAPGIDKESFAAALRGGDVERWLHRVPVKAGDVIDIPAGTIHALGPGILVAEIQQNSNVTYRVYDWGRPRPLHVEKALDVLNFDLVEPSPRSPQVIVAEPFRQEVIGHCPYFHTERLFLQGVQAYAGRCDGSTFELWSVLDGQATLEWRGAPVPLTRAHWVLLPAALGEYRVRAHSACSLLRVLTPER